MNGLGYAWKALERCFSAEITDKISWMNFCADRMVCLLAAVRDLLAVFVLGNSVAVLVVDFSAAESENFNCITVEDFEMTLSVLWMTLCFFCNRPYGGMNFAMKNQFRLRLLTCRTVGQNSISYY